MFWSKLCKLTWNCAWNLAFSVFISPIVWNMCENLPYELVYFKELHNEQECYWARINRAGAAVVTTITSLDNLTSAWCVILLANQHLPYRNQLLVRIMSLLKSILGEGKFLSMSMFRWGLDSLKKFKCVVFVMKYCQLELPYLYLTATNNEEFTG